MQDTAIFESFASRDYNMQEIGDHVGVHYIKDQ